MGEVWSRVAGVTFIAVLISVALTSGSFWFFGVSNVAPAIIMAIVCPLLIAPVVSFGYFKQAAEIDVLVAWLSESNEELTKTSAQLAEMARRDGLTGLLNRNAFFETARAECASKGGAMLMIDADHFKLINDRHGHAAGDAALVAIGQAMRSQVGETALAGRLGGEEFAVFLPSADGDAAAEMAEKLMTAISAAQNSGQRGLFNVTVSVGIASGTPGVSIDALYRASDLQLLQAKRAGRNRSKQLEQRLAA